MFSFRDPVAIRFGRGCAAEALAGLSRPALLVTGEATLQRSGLAALVDERTLVAWPAVRGRPTAATIDAGAARAVALGASTIVGLGGGSALDTAKAIALLAGNGASLHALAAAHGQGDPTTARCAEPADERVERSTATGGAGPLTRKLALVQLPTTAGTGSEVTRWASIWTAGGDKWSLDLPAGYADQAWIDPALGDSMGARLTAAAGLDALAHAIEALWGRAHDPVSDLHATAALALVAEHLLPCVEADGAPGVETHRDAMALAALHAGLAMSHTRTAVAHALSYGLTGRHGLEHGLAVGLLCRGALPLAERLVPRRVERLLAALGRPSVAAAQDFLDQVFAAAGLAPSLAALGVPAAAHAALVETALASERLANGPGECSGDDLLALLETVA